MNSRKQEAIIKLAESIKKQNYRPFIAANGDYGFFTDAAGARVISFGVDLGELKFSGNYKTDSPKTCGTGWRITESASDATPDAFALFNTGAPQWATKGHKWRYTTLAEHLATYGESSKYVEFN